MGDLKDARLIYLKGVLFLLCGALSASILIAGSPDLRTIALLALTVWCFCRCYYFAFYVIEHYVDGNFKFAGLLDFARYCLRRKNANNE